MANGQGQAAVDLPAELAGTVQVVAYRLDAKGYPVRKTRVVYVRPADEVHIAATLDPGKSTYKPGDQPTLRLKLTDKDGKPCPGAVSLDGVDEAVFSVLPQRPGMEQAFYTLDEDLMAPVDTDPSVVAGRRRVAALPAGAFRRGVAGRTQPNPPPPGVLDGGMPPLVRARAIAPGVPPLMDEIAPVQTGTTHTLVVQTYQVKVQETAKERGRVGPDEMAVDAAGDRGHHDGRARLLAVRAVERHGQGPCHRLC